MNQHFRSLIILQGDAESIIGQLTGVTSNIAGDWVIITEQPTLTHLSPHIWLSEHAKLLLGREFKHAIFDARASFNLEAFAILSGTLVADSLFILLLAEDLTIWQDKDSLRWHEDNIPLNVPNFVSHLQRIINRAHSQYPNNIFCNKINKLCDSMYLFDFIKENILIAQNVTTFAQYDEQSEQLNQINITSADIVLLTAKRGRGKSALAGMFAGQHHCWITAPNKNSVITLKQFAPPDTPFFAPDELIEQLRHNQSRPDWLIIDEAAMIPLPILTALLNQWNKVLLTTTIDGYEGTGQGLLLKLFEQIQLSKSVAYYQLTAPIRWSKNDPVEYFVDELMIANPTNEQVDINQQVQISQLTQTQLVSSAQQLKAFFSLLKTAHYRTTLIDLRRLLDGQNLNLYCAKRLQSLVGVLVTIKEGRLSDPLIEQIWQGKRRPRGNLVAQSLVAHGGEKQAARLHSIRINRIAVREDCRRQGIAKKLIQNLIQHSQSEQCDFISVSFAYSIEMYQFWSTLGFTVVHIGTHQEASSGSYAAMAILPVTDAGQRLKQHMQYKLSRNWYWLRHWIAIDLPIKIDDLQQITTEDRLELMHFATTFYPYTACLAALARLADWFKHYYPNEPCAAILLDMVANQLPENSVVEKYGLSGKQMLLKRLRQDVYKLLITTQEWLHE